MGDQLALLKHILQPGESAGAESWEWMRDEPREGKCTSKQVTQVLSKQLPAVTEWLLTQGMLQKVTVLNSSPCSVMAAGSVPCAMP